MKEEEVDLDFVSLWIMLYERQGDKWVKLVNASSFKEQNSLMKEPTNDNP